MLKLCGAAAADVLRKRSHIYSLWGSNPRPMAHKTIALTTELREPLWHAKTSPCQADKEFRKIPPRGGGDVQAGRCNVAVKMARPRPQSRRKHKCNTLARNGVQPHRKIIPAKEFSNARVTRAGART